MSFSNHAISSLKSNRNLRKHKGYIKTKGKKIVSDMRIGTKYPKYKTIKNTLQLRQEREALMRKKGIKFFAVFGISFLILTYLVVWLVG